MNIKSDVMRVALCMLYDGWKIVYSWLLICCPLVHVVDTKPLRRTRPILTSIKIDIDRNETVSSQRYKIDISLCDCLPNCA